MVDDRSYGVIPFRFVDGTPRFLMVWEKWGRGHWGFPKGHPQGTESERETALRELLEEAGLVPWVLLDGDPFVLSYSYWHRGWKVNKVVEFFLALMGEENPHPQEQGITACRWMTLGEVLAATPYSELRNLATRAHRAVVGLQG